MKNIQGTYISIIYWNTNLWTKISWLIRNFQPLKKTKPQTHFIILFEWISIHERNQILFMYLMFTDI